MEEEQQALADARNGVEFRPGKELKQRKRAAHKKPLNCAVRKGYKLLRQSREV